MLKLKMKLLYLAFLISLFTFAESSCTVNADCPVKGECCSSSTLTCRSTTSCITSDGLKGYNANCSSNSECATGCCDYFWDDCSTGSLFCMDDPQGLAGKGIFVIILALIAIVAIILVFCIGYRKMKKAS